MVLRKFVRALQDPRMIDVLGALMGIDLQATTRPEGSDELPETLRREPPTPSSPPPSQASSSKPQQAPPATPAQDVEMEDDSEDARAQKDAKAAKEAGSAAYKKRDFEEAAKQFQLAWDTWPQDLVYLTNLGG
jgi:stress-induced-phosphoprotein 1